MNDSILGFLSFVGAAAIFAASLVGGYVWLRWGWCGVAAIFARRHDLDRAVQDEVDRTLEGLR